MEIFPLPWSQVTNLTMSCERKMTNQVIAFGIEVQQCYYRTAKFPESGGFDSTSHVRLYRYHIRRSQTKLRACMPNFDSYHCLKAFFADPVVERLVCQSLRRSRCQAVIPIFYISTKSSEKSYGRSQTIINGSTGYQFLGK